MESVFNSTPLYFGTSFDDCDETLSAYFGAAV
nr:MAG TPA: hypothetical protein [Caudoviricetes sp.]